MTTLAVVYAAARTYIVVIYCSSDECQLRTKKSHREVGSILRVKLRAFYFSF